MSGRACILAAGSVVDNVGHSSGRRKVTNTRFLNNVVRGVQGHNRAVMVGPSSAETRERTREHDDRVMRDGKRQDEVEWGRQEKRRGTLRGWSDDEEVPRQGGEEAQVRRRPSHSPRRHARTESEEREREERHLRKEGQRTRRSKDADKDKRGATTSRHKHHSSSRNLEQRDSKAVAGNTHGTAAGEEETPSKMDRYFAKNYDPMLDVSAAMRENDEGLIEDDGWDRMLRVVKEKEERRQARRDKRAGEKGGMTRASSDLMDTRYASRGSVREWDKGKETR